MHLVIANDVNLWYLYFKKTTLFANDINRNLNLGYLLLERWIKFFIFKRGYYGGTPLPTKTESSQTVNKRRSNCVTYTEKIFFRSRLKRVPLIHLSHSKLYTDNQGRRHGGPRGPLPPVLHDVPTPVTPRYCNVPGRPFR